jgi:hypothetical protein
MAKARPDDPFVLYPPEEFPSSLQELPHGERSAIMLLNFPTLEIRFDISKIDSAAYGIEAWKIFWQAIDIQKLPISLLFEGDTMATLKGDENVFCIAIQNMDPGVLDAVRDALLASADFLKVCAPRALSKGFSGEPLVSSGRVDALGDLVDGGNAGAAFNAVKRQPSHVAG